MESGYLKTEKPIFAESGQTEKKRNVPQVAIDIYIYYMYKNEGEHGAGSVQAIVECTILEWTDADSHDAYRQQKGKELSIVSEPSH